MHWDFGQKCKIEKRNLYLTETQLSRNKIVWHTSHPHPFSKWIDAPGWNLRLSCTLTATVMFLSIRAMNILTL